MTKKGDFTIRKTTTEDLDRLEEIFERARSFMAATGNPNQWGPERYPPRSQLETDIRTGASYVCEHAGRVVGTFFFSQGKMPEPTYSYIEGGSWLSDSDYGVIHRIASDGSVPGTGTFCILWCRDQCPHIRIDTHEDNVVMQHLLTKLGFSYRGIIYLENGRGSRLAYEKV